MPEPKRAADASHSSLDDDEAPESDTLSGDALDLAGLRTRGDVEGLLVLAKAYRSGSAPGGRDLKKCLDAYRAAAELGSGAAEYAIALFCMSGGVIPQDLKEGTTRLRSAAEKGSLPAKVYLGNLYELGIYYKADPEKADVWYRNAARAARTTGQPASEEYAQELAELGCVRYVLACVEGTADESEKTRLLQKAKAHGHGLRIKEDVPADRPTLLNALEGAETPDAKAPPAAASSSQNALPGPSGSQPALDPRKEAPSKTARSEGSKASAGLTAFGYGLLFVVAGVGSAYAATLGGRELVAHGHPLPYLGARTDLIFPIVFGAIGVLPTFLVYRFGAVAKALVIGAALGGVGWVAWGTGRAELHSHRPIQAFTFAVAGFVAGLLVLGLMGGAKREASRRTRRHLSG
jgi:hypothetical protein